MNVFLIRHYRLSVRKANANFSLIASVIPVTAGDLVSGES